VLYVCVVLLMYVVCLCVLCCSMLSVCIVYRVRCMRVGIVYVVCVLYKLFFIVHERKF